MGLISKKGLIARIRRSKESREALVENNLAQTVAFQIAATRSARGMTQADLAKAAGISTNFPRLEDPDYGKQTLSTLKKIAAALDVALVVRFVAFSEYVDWLSGTPYTEKGLRSEALVVPGYQDEMLAGSLSPRAQVISFGSAPERTPSVSFTGGNASIIVIPNNNISLQRRQVAS